MISIYATINEAIPKIKNAIQYSIEYCWEIIISNSFHVFLYIYYVFYQCLVIHLHIAFQLLERSNNRQHASFISIFKPFNINL